EYLFLLVLSYLLFPFLPSFLIRKDSLREVLRFSKGMLGLSLLNILYLRADIFVLGKLVSPEELGIYTLAIFLAQVPAAFILNYQSQLLIPVFARLQDNCDR